MNHTKRVITQMLQENTGAHMLDSGETFVVHYRCKQAYINSKQVNTDNLTRR
jgi:hypothetical protein